MKDEHGCLGPKMHSDMRWLIGGVFSAIALMLIIGIPLLMKIGAMETSIYSLNETMRTIVLTDMDDLKKRLIVMEQKDILPRAERIVESHEARIRELEKQILRVDE